MDNSVLIVLPVLTLLMFDLGLGLRPRDFMRIFNRPRALFAGLTGQILLLPAMAFAIGRIAGLEETFMTGLLLLACCPGGSSSNVFSGLAQGNVALSVSLTACSSALTLVTMPLLLGSVVELPVSNLVMQNLVLVLLPIIAGMLALAYLPRVAHAIHNVLSRMAFPLLVLLAVIFFLANRDVIIRNFSLLGSITALLVIGSMLGAAALAWLAHTTRRERRTLIIEVGMQNAAQAIALAVSPIVFDNAAVAVPAIVYALMMNVFLLAYVAIVRRGR